MSWGDAKQEGYRRAEIMLEQIAHMPCPPDVVTLTDYEDEETFAFLTGMPGEGQNWPYGFFKMVNRAAKRRLRKGGLRVVTVTIRLRDYLDWLTKHGLQNTTESRAAFVGEITAAAREQ